MTKKCLKLASKVKKTKQIFFQNGCSSLRELLEHLVQIFISYGTQVRQWTPMYLRLKPLPLNTMAITSPTTPTTGTIFALTRYCIDLHTFFFSFSQNISIFVGSGFVLTILDMRHRYERKTPNYSLWYAATQYMYIYISQNVTNSLKWIEDFSCDGTLFHNILIEILVTEIILWE